MRDELGALSVAYLVAAGLFGGAMFADSAPQSAHRIATAAQWMIDAAEESFGAVATLFESERVATRVKPPSEAPVSQMAIADAADREGPMQEGGALASSAPPELRPSLSFQRLPEAPAVSQAAPVIAPTTQELASQETATQVISADASRDERSASGPSESTSTESEFREEASLALDGLAAEVVVAEAPSAVETHASRGGPGDELDYATEDYYAPIEAAQLAQRVESRLRSNLSGELYAKFGLFIYISKAQRGPWAQRMYVFSKEYGALDLLHAWPVSTGREGVERLPSGQRTSTSTPAGYFQFDPNRMYRDYRSVQWDAPMPNAMFLNWVDRGMLTGIAIHGVVGHEIASLGERASAGCIRLSPQAAAMLFELVKNNYRGEIPEFSYDVNTATLSRDGALARREDGGIRYTDGYRVLIFIDNFGGEDPTAIF